MKTPWHIWVVGLVTLLWHAGGAYDYLMTALRDPGYLAMVPEGDRAGFMAYLEAMPIWATSTWALGVWGAVAGSLLILLRSRHAVAGFAVALFGMIATSVYTYGLAPAAATPGPQMMNMLFSAAIVIILVAAFDYSRRQVAAGNLR